jgi:hypothetical protein
MPGLSLMVRFRMGKRRRHQPNGLITIPFEAAAPGIEF